MMVRPEKSAQCEKARICMLDTGQWGAPAVVSLRLTKCRDHRNICRWEGRPKKGGLDQCERVCVSDSGMRRERLEIVVGPRMSGILLFLHARISWSAWSCVSFNLSSGFRIIRLSFVLSA
jgi:hypothetical protein